MIASCRARGFTLIELLIVVAIISFIAAVMIPALLRQMERRQEHPAVAGPSLSQAAPSAAAVPASGSGASRVAHIESSDVRVDLHASQVLDGGAVHTQYEAAFTGTFVIRSADPGATGLSFHFPFPPDVTEARDVSLRVLEQHASPAEAPPGSVVYQRGGIRWADAVPPGQPVTLMVSYLAQGRDAFEYDAVGGDADNARSGAVRFALHYGGVRPVVPPSSLQPAEAAQGSLAWRFSGLITNKPIHVDLPAGDSPLGRLILLCQLAGLAVLLFGAGFWYLSEGQRPGGLDQFRLGHFLLLALTYSLFFAIFAVVGYRGHTALALGCGAVASLPLLMLHTSRTSGWPFTLRRALPLALFSLGSVVLGVYLEDERAYVFLGVLVTIIAYTTLTYRGWAAGRLAHRLGELERTKERAEAVDREATWLLLEHPTLAGMPELEREAGSLGRHLSRVRTLTADRQGVALAEMPMLRLYTEAVVERIATLRRTLERTQAKAEQERRGVASGARCVACGSAANPGTDYCPDCGTQRPVHLACAACGEAAELPVHLFKRSWHQQPVHCAACGERLQVPAQDGAQKE